ncbi:hypothetical protein Pfo_031643 [Paulownia fortunei]|nr:hypothetical protein Pfo_031643 [Paulownia fortunei]
MTAQDPTERPLGAQLVTMLRDVRHHRECCSRPRGHRCPVRSAPLRPRPPTQAPPSRPQPPRRTPALPRSTRCPRSPGTRRRGRSARGGPRGDGREHHAAERPHRVEEGRGTQAGGTSARRGAARSPGPRRRRAVPRRRASRPCPPCRPSPRRRRYAPTSAGRRRTSTTLSTVSCRSPSGPVADRGRPSATRTSHPSSSRSAARSCSGVGKRCDRISSGTSRCGGAAWAVTSRCPPERPPWSPGAGSRRGGCRPATTAGRTP